MPSETSEGKAVTRVHQSLGHPPPPQAQPLPCPRCDSTSTKFCYYNNYNLSQPRHFCKSCRRYWTQGGTLRNVPVGGGTRKAAMTKRSRSATCSSSTSSSSSSSSTLTNSSDAVLGNPAAAAASGLHGENMDLGGGSFNFLLNSQGPSLLGLSGYGLGLGPIPGFDEMGFGLGRGSWTFPEVGDFGGGGSGNGADVASLGFNTWQMNGAEAGGVADSAAAAGDSIPGQGLKWSIN